ncbi:MAG: ABC transporter ATP-binding protein [Reyranella sp.]|uniref:ABC transporter transmembrane domain-containing protein n=1 Tax=Reyranella sp. TaxID=1929291 RepID=UPI0011F40C02|nr:ABC transporter transmembrane domain-containing protein [Reyranella sp.]TAJ97949.1 MAG: ABC transporter ATP-binding protein [Reyranella sp.]
MPSTILGFVLHSSGRHQAALAILSVLVFLLSAAPLELQRRVINVLVDRGAFETVLWLAAAYVGVVLSEQSLKLCLNVYRGWVAEDSVRRLRSLVGVYADRATRDVSGEEAGVEISMVLEEAEPIGSFTGVSLSEPLLQGGVLASVIVYMLYLDWRMALLGLAFFLPQALFVPFLQRAINRRAQSRILVKRGISGGLVSRISGRGGSDGRIGWGWTRDPIERVFTLNMGIYRIKFTMNLLMNMMHHLAVASALGFGGWQVLQGTIEVGTVVAVVAGLGRLNDPWGDIVNWARELAVVGVKYRLFAGVLEDLATPAGDHQPT